MTSVADIIPSTQDVADLIPRLVPDSDGTETGTFTDTTNPSAEAVDRLAGRAAAWVFARFPTLSDAEVTLAKDVAALITAARVARPLDPSGKEYDRLRTELDSELTNLRAVLTDSADGTLDGGSVPSPQDSFPDPVDRVGAGAERPWFGGWPYTWPYA